ncbi:MAG: ABC transporter permease, partial [Clostridia bacterium]|nr:ABC transporter permease [Clostridia bacterium]
MLDITDRNLLQTISDLSYIPPQSAYNIRKNGAGIERRNTEKVEIVTKTDKPGIDIRVKPGTVGETVYIPVIITDTGVNDKVYNDFYIGEDADVTIVAGCGIHNSGCHESRH